MPVAATYAAASSGSVRAPGAWMPSLPPTSPSSASTHSPAECAHSATSRVRRTFRSNGKCLDVKGNNPGDVVQLWPCNGLGYQWWVLRDDKTVYNPSSGLCLTDPSESTSTGTQQVIDTCTGAWTQRWSF